MGKKTRRAKAILKRTRAEGIKFPSPDEVQAAASRTGGWSAATLAKWGIAWPPKHGWRVELERRWRAQNRIKEDPPKPITYGPSAGGHPVPIEASDQLPWES